MMGSQTVLRTRVQGIRILVTTIALGLALSACNGTDVEERTPPELDGFAREVTQVLDQVDATHAAAEDLNEQSLPASELEASYRQFEQTMSAAYERVRDLPVPDTVEEARVTLASLLKKEESTWTHLLLYARTGDERHQVIADDLDRRSEEDRSTVLGIVQALLVEEGADPSDVGLALRPPPSSTPPGQSAGPPTTTTTPPTQQSVSESLPSVAIDLSVDEAVDQGILTAEHFRLPSGEIELVAHWTVRAQPGEVTVLRYPFAANEDVAVDFTVGTYDNREELRRAYFEAPDGERLLDLEDYWGWQYGNLTTRGEGEYRFMLDYTDGSVPTTIHLVISYATAIPGSLPPELEED